MSQPDAFTSVADAIQATAPLYARVKAVIPPEEWALFAPDILAIQRLKKERNAVLLAHNYMTPEIYYGVADIVGDSLALARQAAKTQADVILVAGVSFMAETAKLMNPERIVLSPDPEAGCSLAASITPDDVATLRARHPGVPVVSYVNTSAAVKAVSDLCCTSGNAQKVVESLGVPEVIMIPDRFLAENVAAQTKVKVHTWHGTCEVHERFSAGDVKAYRADHPGLMVLAHPECPPEVVAQADYSGSTAGMAAWVEAHHPEAALLLTECSMSDNVAAAHPEVRFVRPCHLCPHMKRITLAKLRRALETMTTEVTIPAALAAPARLAVERMIAIG